MKKFSKENQKNDLLDDNSVKKIISLIIKKKRRRLKKLSKPVFYSSLT